MSGSSDYGRKPDAIRILIADDHSLMRTGLRMILQLEQDMEVVGDAKNGAEAFELALALRPAIVLADISMPPPNGIELTRLLTRDAPDLKTIIVTMHEEDTVVHSALSAGAAGYVIKRSGPEELIRAIRDVAAGRNYLDPELQAREAWSRRARP